MGIPWRVYPYLIPMVMVYIIPPVIYKNIYILVIIYIMEPPITHPRLPVVPPPLPSSPLYYGNSIIKEGRGGRWGLQGSGDKLKIRRKCT